jgi:branched-chain amino acid transport system permease protein
MTVLDRDMNTTTQDAPAVDAIFDDESPAQSRRRWSNEGITNPHIRRGLYAAAGCLGFLIFIRFIYTAPPEILLQGAILGSLSGMVAMGLVLIYRADRVINFAQGDLGGVSGVLMSSLLAGTGIPFVIAIFLGVGAGIATGAIVQLLLIRRFSNAPRLILTVVTVLASSLLAFVQLVIPQLFDLTFAPQGLAIPFPFFEWQFGVLVFRGSHLTVAIVVPIFVIGLNLFFKFSRLGKAVRASAESRDRALLLGIPVKQVNLAVWIIAATFSAVAAVLRTFIIGAPIGSVLGLTLLIPAIAAAVIAKMENLWVAFASAVAIGMVSEAVFFDQQRTSAVPPVLFAIVIAALLVQSRGKVSRADDGGQSSFSALREVRPIPPELKDLPIVRYGLLAMRVPVFLILVVYPIFLGTGRLFVLSFGIIYAIAALSLVILTGWTGQISLGQLGFAGFGGALAGAMHAGGWNILTALLCGSLLGSLVAVIVGIPALRIKGLFLAVATITFTSATGSYFLNPQEFSWVPAYRLPVRPMLFNKFDLETEHTFYYFCLALLALVLISMRSIRASRTGRVFLAIRENERAAQAFSVNVIRAKLIAFAMAGFVAALAGGLFAIHGHGRLTVLLGAEENLRLFLIAVVGGLGSATGVLASVALFQFVDFFVPSAEFRLLFGGIGVLLILTVYPSGLGGIIYDLRDNMLLRIAKARGIHVPSLVADSREESPIDAGAPR